MPLTQVPSPMLAPGTAGTGPAFSATTNVAQTPTSGVATKVQFNTEEFDTANCFDPTTNYRFTPNVAGYYSVVFSLLWNSITANTYEGAMIYKNGGLYKATLILSGSITSQNQVTTTAIIYMNGSTDYIEAYAYHNGTAQTNANSVYTFFQAALVRAA